MNDDPQLQEGGAVKFEDGVSVEEPEAPQEPAPRTGELSEDELDELFTKRQVRVDDPAVEERGPSVGEDPNVAELRKRRTWG